MIKTLQNTLKQDREGFVLPKSVQDAIPIRRLWPDGIFQFGSSLYKTLDSSVSVDFWNSGNIRININREYRNISCC